MTDLTLASKGQKRTSDGMTILLIALAVVVLALLVLDLALLKPTVAPTLQAPTPHMAPTADNDPY